MGQPIGGPGTRQRNRSNITDLLRRISVKASIADGKICNLTAMFH